MKHCILAKFTPEAKAQRAALLPRIREIFSAAADIPGVHGAEVIPNCVDRDNRYDVLIRLDMDREALPLYDVSAMHHRWKDEFTPLLEKKDPRHTATAPVSPVPDYYRANTSTPIHLL